LTVAAECIAILLPLMIDPVTVLWSTMIFRDGARKVP
jgi:hypothetical protein